jgi:pectinesterase
MTRRSFVGTTAAAAASPMLGMVAGEGTVSAQQEISVEKDVVFAKGGDMDLRLDIYRPRPGTEKRMATVHFHGGGFTGGNKESLEQRVRPLVNRGYVGVVSQYRLTGQAKWPAMMHDVKAAIRWTRANAASLGIEPDRIAVVGYSAGGQLALFAAGTQNRAEFEGAGGHAGVSSAVAACCAYYPGTSIRPRANGEPHVLLPPGSDEAAHRAASPITYVAAGFAPTVIFHGTADTTIAIASSEELFAKLRSANVPAEFHALEGLPHIFDRDAKFADACGHFADLFLDRHVINPART